MTDLIPVLNLGEDNACRVALTEISNRNKDECALTTEQAATHNEHLVGQRSDTLDLLTPSAPLGPVLVLLEQMRDAVERLEQLVGALMDPKMRCQVMAKGPGVTSIKAARVDLKNWLPGSGQGLLPQLRRGSLMLDPLSPEH